MKKAIVTGNSGKIRHYYRMGTRVRILKNDGTDSYCIDAEGLKQYVRNLDLNFSMPKKHIPFPVGLIGSPSAIRAYLAHEAKKPRSSVDGCPECPGCMGPCGYCEAPAYTAEQLRGLVKNAVGEELENALLTVAEMIDLIHPPTPQP
jgi:hypothetical protein